MDTVALRLSAMGEMSTTRSREYAISGRATGLHANFSVLRPALINMGRKGLVMGLFDFFKKKPSENAVLGQVRKAKEVYAQPEYRRMAMEKLLKWNTDESLKGVLERFSVVVQSPHWDEDEKRWLVEELVKLGDRVLPILRDFVLQKNEVNHVLAAYKAIVNNDEKFKNFLKEALSHRPPSDHRSVQGKQELIALMAEFKTDNLADLLVPYLDDHSDDVQCTTLDILAANHDPVFVKKLVAIIGSEAHSARVLRKAAQIMLNQSIKIDENVPLSDVLREDYKIQSGLLVKH